jgi:hypothetical protein
MMTEVQTIVAYRFKGEWYRADKVQADRQKDQGTFVDALPYSLVSLRRRREYGRDVPEWIKLDEQLPKA